MSNLELHVLDEVTEDVQTSEAVDSLLPTTPGPEAAAGCAPAKQGPQTKTGDSRGKRGDRNLESGHCRHTAGTVVTRVCVCVCVPETYRRKIAQA